MLHHVFIYVTRASHAIDNCKIKTPTLSNTEDVLRYQIFIQELIGGRTGIHTWRFKEVGPEDIPEYSPLPRHCLPLLIDSYEMFETAGFRWDLQLAK